MSRFKAVFMGTPDFAAASLEALLSGPDEVVAVVTQPDRPSGRGRKVTESPVKRRAVAGGLPVLQPERLKGEKGRELRADLSALAPDIVVVAAYGQILPPEILELPPFGCVNVHASLLPRWRGASPIQWAIAAGDKETGISIMRMDAGLDTGPVLLRRSTTIEPDDTGGALHDRLSRLGGRALMEALELLHLGEDEAEEQDEALATYAPLLKREDGKLDFSLPAEKLALRVRAFQPWPGAFTRLGDRLLKVKRAQALPASNDKREEPGVILAAGPGGIDVACGEGLLRLLEVQPEGKRPMSAEAFAAGRSSLIGTRAY